MSDVVTPSPSELDRSSGSRQKAVARTQFVTDPQACKRVCFYKSGDPQFRGLRVVINGRTFKTFDALLDNLSKKVPLPFGVRNITTPHGTHAVHTLEELEDGKSYVCSDQKKVKPVNLERATKKLLPWNMTQAVSAGRRRNVNPEGLPVLRLPRALTVFRNGDPSARHTVVLHRRMTQTFESVLEHVSETMQFPVLKLYSLDGRRIDSLPALSLCTGVVVAAGRESFRSSDYDLQNHPQTMGTSGPPDHMEPNNLQPNTRHPKSSSVGSKSRVFSPSSERYFVDQINSSISRSSYGLRNNPMGSVDANVNDPAVSTVTQPFTGAVDVQEACSLLPLDDDIEKSIRVNQDGSMTVEMKVRLRIKSEETIHWTTTVARSSITDQIREGREVTSNGSREENNLSATRNGDATDEEEEDVEKPRLQRVQTPGPRRVKNKQPSVESNEAMSETEAKENQTSTYSCSEETTAVEEYCVVSHHRSRPVPKPRKACSARPDQNKICSSSESSRVRELFQNCDNGDEMVETVLCSLEQLNSYDNYLSHAKSGTAGQSTCETVFYMVPGTTDCNPNDVGEISVTSESQNERQADILSLSSNLMVPYGKIMNDLSSCTDSEAHTLDSVPESYSEETEPLHKTDLPGQISNTGKKRPAKLKRRKGPSSLTASPDKTAVKTATGIMTHYKRVQSSDVLRQTVSQQRTDLVRESDKNPSRIKKKKRGGGGAEVAAESLSMPVKLKRSNRLSSQKEFNQAGQKSVKDGSLNMNINHTPSSPRKEVLETSQVNKRLTKQTSAREDTRGKTQELSESISLPAFHSNVNEYVESWLEKIRPESASYADDMNHVNTEKGPKVVFQIGSDSSEVSLETKVQEEECLGWENHCVERQMPHHHLGDMVGGGSCNLMSSPCVKRREDPLMIAKNQTDLGVPFNSRRELKPVSFNSRRELKPVPGQLGSTLKTIRHISCRKWPSRLEKSHSFPEVSSHMTTPIGASVGLLLAFLTLMMDAGGSHPNNEGCSKALTAIRSLQKMASIEDADELKASLSDLQRSTSAQLLQNWKILRELDDRREGQRSSLRNLEYESQSEASSDGSQEKEEPSYKIQELMEELIKELGMSEEFHKALRSIVKELMNAFRANGEQAKLSEEGKNESSLSFEFEALKRVVGEEEQVPDIENWSSRGHTTRPELVPGQFLNGEWSCASPSMAQSESEGFTRDNNETLTSPVSDCEKNNGRADPEENEVEEHGWKNNSPCTVEVSQAMLDFINSALMPSSLSLSYDSHGNLKINHERTQVESPAGTLLGKSKDSQQYGHKRLPSPNTSDLSDYRPETPDSDGYKSQESVEIHTESGDDDFDRQSVTTVRRNNSNVKTFSPATCPNQKLWSGEKSIDTLTSDHCMMAKESCLDTASSLGDHEEATEYLALNVQVDTSEGVLIDKGQWLLKENHLIRKSPPEFMGMYGSAETTSADSCQETGSDDIPYTHCGSHHAALHPLSSSELEELAKPETPQCTYFTAPHGSDSDPFQDDPSGESSTESNAAKRRNELEVSPPAECRRTGGKRKSSKTSFASVEFRMPDGRVHPLASPSGAPTAEVAPPAEAPIQGVRLLQEQDSVEKLNFRCGQLCAIQ